VAGREKGARDQGRMLGWAGMVGRVECTWPALDEDGAITVSWVCESDSSSPSCPPLVPCHTHTRARARCPPLAPSRSVRSGRSLARRPASRVAWFESVCVSVWLCVCCERVLTGWTGASGRAE
jgi:hypothetical protein